MDCVHSHFGSRLSSVIPLVGSFVFLEHAGQGQTSKATGVVMVQLVLALAVAYALVIVIVAVGIHIRWAGRGTMKWQAVTWDHVTKGSDRVPAGRMAAIRLGMAVYVAIILLLMLRGAGGSGSALSGGIWTLATFTVWCWEMLGVYFVLSGAASLSDACGGRCICARSKVMANFLWVYFQVMFIYAWLVCLVVWMVLIPGMYIYYGSDGGLLSFSCVSMHNVNVLFMLVEMKLNRMIFVRSHVVFTLYFGFAYIVFSWLWYLKAGYFFYFFIDATSPIVFVGYTMLILVTCCISISSDKIVRKCKSRVHGELPDLRDSSLEGTPSTQHTGVVSEC